MARIPTGENLIGGAVRAGGQQSFRAEDPKTGALGDVHFVEATTGEIDEAVTAATDAFIEYRQWPISRVADLLLSIADELEADRARLMAVADVETALGDGRLDGELTRTTLQFRSFARWIQAGRHLSATISRAGSQGQGNPDIRRTKVALGPVAVFGASNFPFAFSVPGGDTAAALAAGCAVIVKAHPSHPGTSELCARAILRACDGAAAPAGLFSMVHARDPEVSQHLVRADGIAAVAFTGSLGAGRAIFDAAAGRERPIPVYAEMASVNPVLITERAARVRGREIARGLAGSITMGMGQFCTKPGLVFLPAGPVADDLVRQLADQLASTPTGALLNTGIRRNYLDEIERTQDVDGVEVLVADRDHGVGSDVGASLLDVTGSAMGRDASAVPEHFGPASVLIRYKADQLASLIHQLDGGLTLTVHAEHEDLQQLAPHLPAMALKAGRIVWNGYPTGVSVVEAQHHGGPYPATTNSLHTSVGAYSIDRFLRPISYQGVPAELLPAALQDDNPLGIDRLVGSQWTRDPCS